MDLSDEALIDRFRQTNDQTFFKSLVRRYQNRIYNASYRILGSAEEAEEVVQDTCLKVHQNIAKFKAQSSFAAWIFRIAHNTCLDFMRMRQRRKGLQIWSFNPQSAPDWEDSNESQVVLQVTDPKPSPADQLDMSEQGELIASSLKQLPESQRVVVVLHDVEGFSYQEISEIVGANLGTVRSRLHYGRIKLREILEPYFSAQNATPASR